MDLSADAPAPPGTELGGNGPREQVRGRPEGRHARFPRSPGRGSDRGRVRDRGREAEGPRDLAFEEEREAEAADAFQGEAEQQEPGAGINHLLPRRPVAGDGEKAGAGFVAVDGE